MHEFIIIYKSEQNSWHSFWISKFKLKREMRYDSHLNKKAQNFVCDEIWIDLILRFLGLLGILRESWLLAALQWKQINHFTLAFSES